MKKKVYRALYKNDEENLIEIREGKDKIAEFEAPVKSIKFIEQKEKGKDKVNVLEVETEDGKKEVLEVKEEKKKTGRKKKND